MVVTPLLKKAAMMTSSSSSFSLLEVDKRNPLQKINKIKFVINNIQLPMIKSKIEHIIQWFECQYKSL